VTGSSSAPSRRSIFAASFIGTSIEWYDYYIFGTAAALVFGTAFFGASSVAGTLAAFATFAVGFIARPLGAAVIGHFGDRIGRKSMLVLTLLLTGGSTFLIGLLPTYDAIGIGAPLLLVVLRLIQGFGVGGEWGGAVLIATEHASPRKRAVYGSFAQFGVPMGVLTSNLAFLAVSGLDNEAFLSWGWRIPFLVSVVMFAVVLYIQSKVEDTPEFRDLQKEVARPERAVVRAPLANVIRTRWGTILLACGILSATNSLFYVSIAGLLNYGTTSLKLDRSGLLTVVLLSSVAMLAVLPWAGHVSDRIGRRPLILIGGLGVALWGFPYFGLVNTASLPLIFVAVVVGFIFQSLTYGPIASFLGELFAPNVRYSGASLSYQLSAIIISGGTPFLMTALIAETGSTWPAAAYITAMGLITFVSAWFLPETNPAEVRADPRAVPGTHLYR
jgi:MFS family permease